MKLKIHFDKLKTKFVEKSADKVFNIVDKVPNKEIHNPKKISTARKNDFGLPDYLKHLLQNIVPSYLNEKSETAKLMKVVELKDKQLAEAKVEAVEKQKLAESKDAEIAKITEVVHSVRTQLQN